MIQPNILKKLDFFLDQYYEKSVTASKHLHSSFSESNAGKTQVRNLENVAYTSMRFSSIINFIKNQMGKDSPEHPTWTRKLTGDVMVGDFLLGQLDEIRQHAETLTTAGPDSSLEYTLYLARGWARQICSNYLYLVVTGG